VKNFGKGKRISTPPGGRERERSGGGSSHLLSLYTKGAPKKIGGEVIIRSSPVTLGRGGRLSASRGRERFQRMGEKPNLRKKKARSLGKAAEEGRGKYNTSPMGICRRGREKDPTSFRK